VTADVRAPAACVLLELLAAEGDTVGVGQPLATLGVSEEAAAAPPAPAPAAAAPEPVAEPAAAAAAAPAHAEGHRAPMIAFRYGHNKGRASAGGLAAAAAAAGWTAEVFVTVDSIGGAGHIRRRRLSEEEIEAFNLGCSVADL